MKKINSKNIFLVVVIIIVASSIYYLNSQRVVVQEFNEQLDEQISDVTVEVASDYIRDDEAIAKKIGFFSEAPELRGIAGYLNTDPNIRIQNLKGKVVLVDFWTYTCINCIRTFPFLNSWHEKYEDDGLVIIGVHTPEFEFEKLTENVQDAIDQYDIEYAVVQDNSYATWRDYANRFWPHKYIIDIDGFIRYDHIGEGGYTETERVIQGLLKERMERIGEGKLEEEISQPADVVK